MKTTETNIVVVRREILVKSFDSESEAAEWIERQKDRDAEFNWKHDVQYEIWHSPYPAAE